MATRSVSTHQRTPFRTIAELNEALAGEIRVNARGVDRLRSSPFDRRLIDRLAYSAVFGDPDVQAVTRWLIRAIGEASGAFLASIHELYMSAGRAVYANATAPAINIRGLTYDMAQSVFRAAMRENTKIVIIEIARSEMGYTNQRPGDFAAAVQAGAIAVGWRGPIFIQGDHFQAGLNAYQEDSEAEIERVRNLTTEALEAGFFNIDVDASTLVDLEQPTLAAQQERNYAITAELTELIREYEPEGVTVSIGGEIGEVGGHNSTVDDLHAFMQGYQTALEQRSEAVGRTLAGISKISVQTGTSHGGVVLPDGSIADVSVDFDTLAALSQVSREEYGLGGAVQHGASTLPEAAFGHFAKANAVEVHLATLFQNMLYEHPLFPPELKAAIYAHLAANHANERKEGQSDAQFYYTTRKRGYGPFKRELWDLPDTVRESILGEIEDSYAFIMQSLGVSGKAELVDSIVRPVSTLPPVPAGL